MLVMVVMRPHQVRIGRRRCIFLHNGQHLMLLNGRIIRMRVMVITGPRQPVARVTELGSGIHRHRRRLMLKFVIGAHPRRISEDVGNETNFGARHEKLRNFKIAAEKKENRKFSENDDLRSFLISEFGRYHSTSRTPRSGKNCQKKSVARVTTRSFRTTLPSRPAPPVFRYLDKHFENVVRFKRTPPSSRRGKRELPPIVGDRLMRTRRIRCGPIRPS